MRLRRELSRLGKPVGSERSASCPGIGGHALFARQDRVGLMRAVLRLLVCSLLLASPCIADAASVLEVQAVPYLNDAGKAAYALWLNTNLPRAFAVEPSGGFSAHVGKPYEALDAVRSAAVEDCSAKSKTRCTLYAENLDVVWPGHESRANLPPGPLLKTWSYSFVPDENFIWHGPAAAKGVLVWGHSYGGPERDNRGIQPQSHNRPLNNVATTSSALTGRLCQMSATPLLGGYAKG